MRIWLKLCDLKIYAKTGVFFFFSGDTAETERQKVYKNKKIIYNEVIKEFRRNVFMRTRRM